MFPVLMIIAPIYRIVASLGLLDTLTSLVVVYTAFNIPSRSS
jgi:multiple sugar transport system permease protein